MRFLLAVFALASLCACAAREAQQPAGPDCDTFYVILPGNFIVDLAAGSKVILDPSAQEFALFCTAKAAGEALENVQPAGDWRIYRLDGESGAGLAARSGNGYVLARPAEVVDWLEVR